MPIISIKHLERYNNQSVALVYKDIFENERVVEYAKKNIGERIACEAVISGTRQILDAENALVQSVQDNLRNVYNNIKQYVDSRMYDNLPLT